MMRSDEMKKIGSAGTPVRQAGSLEAGYCATSIAGESAETTKTGIMETGFMEISLN
ncbi:MAG TPA: hypothetical protein VL550_06160 [Rhodocyclaceae bacterium]|nr:hypothetical protein [Rhodocyclaceae bacterium]